MFSEKRTGSAINANFRIHALQIHRKPFRAENTRGAKSTREQIPNPADSENRRGAIINHNTPIGTRSERRAKKHGRIGALSTRASAPAERLPLIIMQTRGFVKPEAAGFRGRLRVRAMGTVLSFSVGVRRATVQKDRICRNLPSAGTSVNRFLFQNRFRQNVDF